MVSSTVCYFDSGGTGCNEGLLGPSEREELEALVELSEQLSLVRGEALQILGKRP
jgi:hypothetical protein